MAKEVAKQTEVEYSAKTEQELIKELDIQPIEFTKELLEEMSEVDSTGFEENFKRMYEIANKIANKILDEGGDLKDDSYVVREEFGEGLAAGYRYLKTQTDFGKKSRKAGHEEEQVDYELDMYKEFADIFMMTTTFCRHNEWDMNDKTFVIYRPIHMTIEQYLTKASEVVYRISNHYNGHEINSDYIYEFLEETFMMLIDHKDVLSNKIEKLYGKIFKIVE